MTGGRKAQDAESARAAWRLFMDVVFQHTGHFLTVAQALGVNPGSLKLLTSLDPDRPAPMHRLAEHMHCDASMITWLVDRLEERGLVERQASASDRRVKTIVLTRKGTEFQREFEARLYEPPVSFAELSAEDLDTLTRTLRKLYTAGGGAARIGGSGWESNPPRTPKGARQRV